MPSPASPATPHRVTSDTRSHPGTPNTRTEGTSTPNTRKRTRLDYARLHNGPSRNGSPTPATNSSLVAQMRPQQPRQRARALEPRLQRNGRVTNSPLFLPNRDYGCDMKLNILKSLNELE